MGGFSHLIYTKVKQDGIYNGLAFRFKQYALVGIIPMPYLMRVQGDRRYHNMIMPAVLVGLLSSAAVLVLKGMI